MTRKNPESLKEHPLEDCAETAGMLRGLSGELTLINEDIELPGGFKIVARHVEASGKKLDFELQDPHGRRALLEVKAWSPRTWKRELVNLTRVDSRSIAGHLIAQLRAAKATGALVYLVVLDSIGALIDELRRFLDSQGLHDVTVLVLSESKVRSTFEGFKKGFRLVSEVTFTLPDELAEAHDD